VVIGDTHNGYHPSRGRSRAYPRLQFPDRMCVMHDTGENEKKATGRIIRVSKAGWGFISSKEIQFTRIFFHWTALRQDTLTFTELHTGMYVEFTPLQIPAKGYRALHVRVIDKPKELELNDSEATGGDDMSALSEQGQHYDGTSDH
jgi:cold shock CspA family protein